MDDGASCDRCGGGCCLLAVDDETLCARCRGEEWADDEGDEDEQ